MGEEVAKMVSETVNKSGGTQEPQDNSLNEDNKSKGNTKTTSPPNDEYVLVLQFPWSDLRYDECLQY